MIVSRDDLPVKLGGRRQTLDASIPSDKRELPCYIVPAPRTYLSEDRASTSVFDRAGEKKKLVPQIKPQASRTAQGSSISPCFLRMSFSNSDRTTRGGNEYEHEQEQ